MVVKPKRNHPQNTNSQIHSDIAPILQLATKDPRLFPQLVIIQYALTDAATDGFKLPNVQICYFLFLLRSDTIIHSTIADTLMNLLLTNLGQQIDDPGRVIVALKSPTTGQASLLENSHPRCTFFRHLVNTILGRHVFLAEVAGLVIEVSRVIFHDLGEKTNINLVLDVGRGVAVHKYPLLVHMRMQVQAEMNKLIIDTLQYEVLYRVNLRLLFWTWVCIEPIQIPSLANTTIAKNSFSFSPVNCIPSLSYPFKNL